LLLTKSEQVLGAGKSGQDRDGVSLAFSA